MLNNKEILAIVPARGGSKGIPGKNLVEVGGKPLLAWTMAAAQRSKYIDRLVLSSDDQRIITAPANWAAKCLLSGRPRWPKTGPRASKCCCTP